MHTPGHLAELLQLLLDQSITAMNADRGAIFLRDNDPPLQLLASTFSSDSPTLRALAERVTQTQTPATTQDGCAIAAPLQIQGNLAGVISVERARAFEPSDVERLGVIAYLAALAIENAQRYAEAQHTLANLRLLQEISADLTSTLDLENVLTKTLQRVQDVLQVATASFLFREGDELVFQIAIGEASDRIKPYRLKIGQGITGWVAQHAQGDFTNDVSHDPRHYSAVDAGIKFVTHSLIAAPLVVNDQVIGAISATNKANGFNHSDLDLLTTIAGSAAIAIENARLYQVAVEKGRMERELQVARQVQADLIPRAKPEFPGWDIAGMWQPAREVSGDYYDYVTAPHQLDLVIADVSDKGMPAALLMAQTRSIIRANLTPAKLPARGVTRANELICASAPRNMFVTMACVRLDAQSGRIVFVNAGHNRPLICRARTGKLEEISRTGIALGVFADQTYKQRIERLQRGDFVVLFTDGVTDAMNPAGEMFGDERLQKIVTDHHRSSAAELVAAFEAELKKFIGSAAPADDITVLVAKKV